MVDGSSSRTVAAGPSLDAAGPSLDPDVAVGTKELSEGRDLDLHPALGRGRPVVVPQRIGERFRRDELTGSAREALGSLSACGGRGLIILSVVSVR
jgi:hypothetical protein